jgi:hypothetical protein
MGNDIEAKRAKVKELRKDIKGIIDEIGYTEKIEKQLDDLNGKQ